MERKILIAAINSTEYLQQVRDNIDIRYFESRTARLLLTWILEYYDTYNEAPGVQMDEIYMSKVKAGNIDEELALEIEEDILPSLNKQFKKKGVNVRYIVDRSNKFFIEQKLQQFTEEIGDLLEKGDVDEAETIATEYKQIIEQDTDLDFGTDKAIERISEAFEVQGDVLLRYPGVLGEFWNSQMVRGSFISLMAPEKRGKTWQLLEMAIRGVRQGAKVAFFQAGDMTEAQQLRRICINLTKKSDKEKFTGTQYMPVKDCIYNQLDECDHLLRECDFGIFVDGEYTEKTLREELSFDVLFEAYKDNEDYKPCYNCLKYKRNKWGIPWLEKVELGNPLTVHEAVRAFKSFFTSKRRRFKMSTHANGTLSMTKVKGVLNVWEVKDKFVPDIVIIDYADLLIGGSMEFRHNQNEIWKQLRGLSQSLNCLLITATQADANSYEKDTLTLKNFSEDKRKYAHVTAMYGQNQDKEGREKKLGIMRINELVVREDEFDIKRQVVVLQKLSRGRPMLTSYWH